jgi:hypothetical protein
LTFLNPAAFWWFLLLAPLAALFLLKVRPESHATATLFLWDSILRETRSSALFRRLRDRFSLLLLALAFVAVTVALADPVLAPSGGIRSLLLILDRSPSMGARFGRETRFDEAKHRIRSLCEGVPYGCRVTLALADSDVRILSNAAADPRSLDTVLREAAVGSVPFDLRRVIDLVRDSGGRKEERAYLITDGCFRYDGEGIPAGIETVRVGEPASNLGIVAFDLARRSGSEIMALVQVASSFEKPMAVDLLFYCEDDAVPFKLVPLVIPPGTQAPSMFVLDNAPPGRWRVRLDIEDVLEADNTAYGILAAARPVRIALRGDANSRFYRACVDAFNHSDGIFVRDDDSPDVVIGEGAAVFRSTDLPTKWVIVRPFGESPFWKSLGEPLSDPLPLSEMIEHPSIDRVALGTVDFFGARAIEAPEGALAIVSDVSGIPLLYRAESGGHVAYVLNIDPRESEFFLRLHFPVMLYSMVMDLAGRNLMERNLFRSGESVLLPASDNDSLIIERPDGLRTSVQSGVPYRLETPGFYRVFDGKEESVASYAVSLLSLPDTLLRNTFESQSDVRPFQARIPLRSSFFCLAMLALVCECALYHRRKVG